MVADGGEREVRRLRRFEGVEGFAVDLTDAEALAMAGRSGVRFVEPDALRFVADDAMTERMDVRQLSSYGVRMVEANPVWAATRGEGIRVGIIDTGIDVDHPDLAGRSRAGGILFTRTRFRRRRRLARDTLTAPAWPG
jgi:minor extracellular serine protease Vpr